MTNATIHGMSRVRISTTVDRDRLHACRALVALPDSQLIDQALDALATAVLTRQEIDALAAQPYDDDPDLAWLAPPAPDLPYDGEIPAEVLALAKARRRRAGG